MYSGSGGRSRSPELFLPFYILRENNGEVWLENIPIPPTLNRAYPSNRQGRRFKSKELTHWETSFRIWSLTQMDKVRIMRKSLENLPIGHFLAINCVYYFERSRILCKDGRAKKLDIDNRLKFLIDSVTQLLWVDDSNIWQGSFYKRVAAKDEGCSVQMRVIDPNPQPGIQIDPGRS